MKLNEKIICSRKKAGLSQIDLADALGVSRQSVSKWETGESNPDITKLPALAKALDVSIDWLLSEEDPVEEKAPAPDSANAMQDKVYPDWVEHLPKSIVGLIKKYGWIYGVYIAIGGIVFIIFGIFARVLSHNFIFGGSQSFAPVTGGFSDTVYAMGSDPFYPIDGAFSQINNQAWSGFSAITGFVIAIGVIITVFGIVLALSLKKWGKK